MILEIIYIIINLKRKYLNMNSVDKQYLDLCQKVLSEGIETQDRTGTGTLSIFGHQMRFDLSEGFPLLTTKKVYWHGVVQELIWFLKGDTNTKVLNEVGVHIWDEWANDHGELGPIYGKQWRDFNGQGIDQLEEVIKQIKENPTSRRLIVSAWNPAQLDDMALPPCHCFFQFYVRNGKLSCQLYQRSADVFLGLPFNIASYSLLTHIIAKICDLQVGEFIHTIGDAHIYKDHLNQIAIQMRREPKELPTIEIEKLDSVDAYYEEHIKLNNYNPHPVLKGKVSV